MKENTMRKLTYRNLTEQDKQQICQWRYEGRYAVYDIPDYELLKENLAGFADPEKEKDYYAFFDGETLTGYVNIREKNGEVSVGIGVEPHLCGQHYGRDILEYACGISRELHPGKMLSLEVRTWNTRAIRCYEHTGFMIAGEPHILMTGSGPDLFYRMIREE